MSTRIAPSRNAWTTPRLSARRALAWTHRWLGAVSAIFLLFIALSGTALAFMSEMFRWQFGAMLDADPPSTGARYADIDRLVTGAIQGFGKPLTPHGILMPHSRVEVDAAMLYGETPGGPGLDHIAMVAVDPYTGAYQGDFILADAFGHDLIDFHHQLFAGPIGASFSAVLGLLVLLFAVSGLYLWWPRGNKRVLAKAAGLDWRGSPLRKMFRLHSWLGIWAALLVIFFCVTGSATAKPDWFAAAFGDLPHDPPPDAAPLFVRACAGKVSPGAATRLAEAAHPGRRLAAIELPQAAGEPYRLGLKGARDWDVMDGDVAVFVHTSCPGVITSVAAAGANASVRAGAAMFSLHSGRSFGWLGDVLVIVSGLGLAILSASGLYVWLSRLRATTDRLIRHRTQRSADKRLRTFPR